LLVEEVPVGQLSVDRQPGRVGVDAFVPVDEAEGRKGNQDRGLDAHDEHALFEPPHLKRF
jgi:hypothetical protein